LNGGTITQKIYSRQKWIEPWYLAYALLGATSAGLIPILLPVAVSRAGNVFCGWVCPFGTLQDLLDRIRRKLRLPTITVPDKMGDRVGVLRRAPS
jgi:polyferredoxin